MVTPLIKYNPRVLFSTEPWLPAGNEVSSPVPVTVQGERILRQAQDMVSSPWAKGLPGYNSPEEGLYALSLENISRKYLPLLEEEVTRLGGKLSLCKNSGKPYHILLIKGAGILALPSRLGRLKNDLEGLGEAVEETLTGYLRESFSISHSKGRLKLGSRACVMGILNVTPDSFYDGGRFQEIEKAMTQAQKILEEGADIIDIGGVSTRPGSKPVSEEEELRRIIRVIKELSRNTRKPISVDTYRATVAEKALRAGAQIINDTSGLADKDMARVAASWGAPLVIMHIKGKPHHMPETPVYKNLFSEIAGFLRKRVEKALRAGVKGSSLIIDPGLGFGKTHGQSFEILRRLEELRSLGLPILVGTSRKGFLGLAVEERLPGTLATLALAISKGAKIVRVHDVREAVQVASLCYAIKDGRWRGSLRN